MGSSTSWKIKPLVLVIDQIESLSIWKEELHISDVFFGYRPGNLPLQKLKVVENGQAPICHSAGFVPKAELELMASQFLALMGGGRKGGREEGRKEG
ncbi:hypothetical protein L345_02163, partial [Ophiophagus hannah]